MKLIFNLNKVYRKDIDGLRAIAVVAVFIFHTGNLPNGFLGVDIFFVISGYLITRILYDGILDRSLTLFEFYRRRFRRIIPLVLFFCVLSILIGVLIMLPDDLENLSQSNIATILFSNNILLLNTTGDYWKVINEFKPLMHTWSLGIEEQFYILYPFIFFLLRSKKRLILPVVLTLTAISISLYVKTNNTHSLFYLLPFRFFELSIGGLAAILLLYKQILFRYKFIILTCTVMILLVGLPSQYSKFQIPLTCILTVILLITKDTNRLFDVILENKLMVSIGKISFSIYMWHQFLLAFIRYFLIQELTISAFLIIFLITILLSTITYLVIEVPFRNKKIISNRLLFASLLPTSIILVGISYFIHYRSGVIRNVPELDISASKYEKNMHATFVKNVEKNNSAFFDETKIKILVYGDSFAKDWTNVLRESIYNNKLSVIYVYSISDHIRLAKKSDLIFLARLSKKNKTSLSLNEIADLDLSIQKKIWCVGTKNFGLNNGVFYNSRKEGYCNQRTKMVKGYLEENNKLKKEWGAKYIDVIGLLTNDSQTNTVPVFTPNCKFISQDTRHLTKPGAQYLGDLVDSQLKNILSASQPN